MDLPWKTGFVFMSRSERIVLEVRQHCPHLTSPLGCHSWFSEERVQLLDLFHLTMRLLLA